jgi:protein arginine kinase activator
MLCDRCKNKEATVHNITMHGNIKKEEHLCEDCASDLKYFKFAPEFFFHKAFPKFFTPLSGFKEETIKICPHCGKSGAELRKHGKPGCPECYTFFIEELQPLLTRIHGSAIHRGKIPAYLRHKDSELSQLRLRLQQLVKEENYEEAASIRDKIKALGPTEAGEKNNA